MSADEEFERLADMLPFYVNGTLGEPDRTEFEQGLERFPRLRDALEQERILSARITEEARAAVAPAEGHREERLSALLDRLPEPDRQSLLGGAGRTDGPEPTPKLLGALGFLNPARWRPAIALSFALIGVGGISISQAREIAALQEENFRLASGKCEEAATGTVVIEVAPGASWADLQALLDQEGLSIASSGAFGSLVLSGGKEGEAPARLAQRLRSSPVIASADPAA